MDTPAEKFLRYRLGGGNNFHKTTDGLTFYFSERHYLYWKNVSKRIPFFIILQDPASGTIYWQHFSELTIEETTKHWKIDIPIGNVLDETAKTKD